MSLLKEVARSLPLAFWVRHRLLGTIVARRAAQREFGQFRALSAQSTRSRNRFAISWRERQLCLSDRTGAHGFDAHYVYHPAWAARVVAQIKPAYHVDVSSKLDFCTLLSAFVPVRFYDYRPATLQLSGLTSEPGDLTALPFEDDSVPSLSCMHVVEHIGLGRYGDPLDPDGDLKAMAELQRVVARGGSLLFVTPVGKPRLVFNAHRIYSFEQITGAFDMLSLQQFALIPDDGLSRGLILDAAPEMANAQNYGCGCFWFQKP